MKSVPNLDYKMLKTAEDKPVGKYGNLINYLKERGGVTVDENTADKKLRTFFEDLITEILKNPEQFDRTRNINLMELFNYLEGKEEQQQEEQPKEVQASVEAWDKSGGKLKIGDRVYYPNKGIMGKIVEIREDNEINVIWDKFGKEPIKAEMVELIL